MISGNVCKGRSFSFVIFAYQDYDYERHYFAQVKLHEAGRVSDMAFLATV